MGAASINCPRGQLSGTTFAAEADFLDSLEAESNVSPGEKAEAQPKPGM